MLASGVGQGLGNAQRAQQQDALLKALLTQLVPTPLPKAAAPGIPVEPGGVNLRGQMQGAGRQMGLY